MHVKAYAQAYHKDCLNLFKDLVPEYFTPKEQADFAVWLNQNPAHYYVVVDEDRVIGCGGIAFKDDGKTATLCWGLIGLQYHRRGVGSLLLRHRIKEFTTSFPQTESIYLETTQKVQGFFARHGFQVLNVHKDRIGPGLDQVDMAMQL